MALKAVRVGTVFSITINWPERLNDGKGLPRSRWNPKKVHMLHKEQPLSGFRVKQKGLRSKRTFEPKCKLLILPNRGRKYVIPEFLEVK